jgi:capsular exopolysaccharide synthesis family protein
MEFSQAATTLRRWWWLIALSTLLGMAAGYAAQQRLPNVFSATATVMVGSAIENPNPTTTEISLGQQLALTYGEIARRRPVQEAAKIALGITFLPQYSVFQVPNTQLLEIRVSDVDPARAQAVANELARQLIALGPNAESNLTAERRQFLELQISELEASIDTTRALIAELNQARATMYSAREISATDEQIAALERKLRDDQSTYASLLNTLKGGVNTLEVVEWADVPRAPISGGSVQSILVVGAIGFLLSLGTALLLQYMDDMLKTPDDVSRALEVPVLGGIMRLKKPVSKGKTVSVQKLQPIDDEAYRLLLARIEHEGNPQTLMVTSSSPAEGKSTTVANLGAIVAQEDKRVVLIDADMRHPTLHKLFGLPMGEGLSNALTAQDRSAVSYLRQTGEPNLRIMTAGSAGGNPAILLKSERLPAILAELCQETDVIVLDSAPVLAATDALAVASKVQGVLLIVDANRTRRKMAVQAMEMLGSVDARVLGVALNRVGPQVSSYHQYANYYATDSQSDDQSLMGRMKGRLRWSPNRKTS